MDYRTVSVLCMSNLAPLIEAGDFRRFSEAERMVMNLAASVPSTYWRGPLLHQLVLQLSRFPVPLRPECDAFLRAIKAVVRRLHRECYPCQSRAKVAEV